MLKQKRIREAKAFLLKHGYEMWQGHIPKAIDLVVWKDGKPVVVAVKDSSRIKSIPLQGLGTSKRAKTELWMLKNRAMKWLADSGFCGIVRFDAVWLSDNGCISHIVDI